MPSCGEGAVPPTACSPSPTSTARKLTLELFELASSVGYPLQTEVVNDIQRARRPLVILMLMIGPKDQLRDRSSVPIAARPNVARLISIGVRYRKNDFTTPQDSGHRG